MADFKKALKKTLDHEGRVLSNDPLDRGGDTMCGISRRWFSYWPGWDMKGTYETSEDIRLAVANFYFDTFWMPLQCDRMPQAIADKLFDSAVNIGKEKAVQIVQSILGLKTDGIVGPITLAAIASCNVESTLQMYRDIQADYYLSIVRNDHTQERFINGWLARARS